MLGSQELDPVFHKSPVQSREYQPTFDHFLEEPCLSASTTPFEATVSIKTIAVYVHHTRDEDPLVSLWQVSSKWLYPPLGTLTGK